MKTLTEKYRGVLSESFSKKQFVRDAKIAHPTLITSLNSFNDTVKILRNKGFISEKQELPKQYGKYEIEGIKSEDKFSIEAIERGIDIELEAAGLMSQDSISKEDYGKAKEKALANLEKDQNHYLNLMAGESKSVDKHDKMVAADGKNNVDTFNGMKNAELKESKAILAKLLKEGKLEDLAKKLGVPVEKLKGAADKIKSMERQSAERDALKLAKMKEVMDEAEEELAEDAAFKVTREFDTADEWNDDGRDYVAVEDNGKGGSFIIDPNQKKYTPGTLAILEGLEDQDLIWESPEKYFMAIEAMQALKNEAEAENLINQFGTDYVDELELHIAWGNAMFPNEGKEIKEVEGHMIDQHEHEFFSIIFDKKYNDILDDYMSSETFKQDEKELQDETGQANVFDYAYRDKWEHYIKEFESNNYDKLDEKKVKENIDKGDSLEDIKKTAMSQLGGPDTPVILIHDPEAGDRKKYNSTLQKALAYFEKQLPNEPSSVEEPYILKKGRDVGYEEGKATISIEGHLFDIIKKGVAEKKGKDHDGDGDVDGDDYKAAKDKAIKKAMGKDEMMREGIKAIVSKVLEEQVVNEAATHELSKMADSYGDFEGFKQSIIQLEHIVTDIEAYYDKTRSKIQKIYDSIDDIRNEEGLKVGAFLAPAIESAFNKDLRPVIRSGFTKGLETPKVRVIKKGSPTPMDAPIDEIPKKTVFSVNE